MDDAPETESLFKLPDQKTSLEWAFRALMVAAYFWSTSHFVSMERYEKDAEKQGAQSAILINQLSSINTSLAHIEERMKGDDRRDTELEKLDNRLRTVELSSHANH